MLTSMLKVSITLRFVRVNFLPAVSQHVTPKQYVDVPIDESKLFRTTQDNIFKILT